MQRFVLKAGMKVTIMGLGLHGGGASSAEYFLKRGAIVTITDLKKREFLKSSIKRIDEFIKNNRIPSNNVRYVLGRHNINDFTQSDLIIKNPGVPAASLFLKKSREAGIPVETDISIFFSLKDNPIIAVTGSKGKSTTASAIYHCLKSVYPNSRLGGNITVSPLEFADDIEDSDPVVLETSSWQLADLKGNKNFKPKVAVLTNILPDHMDKYTNMNDYIADKKIIFGNQNSNDFAVLNLDDPYLEQIQKGIKAGLYFFSKKRFKSKKKIGAFYGDEYRIHETYGTYLGDDGKTGFLILPDYLNRQTDNSEPPKDLRSSVAILEHFPLPGEHNKINLITAALALALFGVKLSVIKRTLSNFQGIEHRLELFHTYREIRFYNDSAATIPQATIEALKALDKPIFLITGGTDKNLDLTPMAAYLTIPEKIFLLKGSATEKLIAILKNMAVDYYGPYDTLDEAVNNVSKNLYSGVSVLFSPGSTSFELFKNEFHRGKMFKQLIRSNFPQ